MYALMVKSKLGVDVKNGNIKGEVPHCYVWKYSSTTKDVEWGQLRIVDAGFDDFHVVTLGGDKEFLHCLGSKEVLGVFNEVDDFFSQFFYKLGPWFQKTMVYKRWVWVWIYGVSIHAWNEHFFILVLASKGHFEVRRLIGALVINCNFIM
jgi:hypothetical protein